MRERGREGREREDVTDCFGTPPACFTVMPIQHFAANLIEQRRSERMAGKERGRLMKDQGKVSQCVCSAFILRQVVQTHCSSAGSWLRNSRAAFLQQQPNLLFCF